LNSPVHSDTMPKINQIQNKIRELDGAAFQKLADAYLYRKGYERINPIGSLIGANKVRKGTPDTFIALENGNYIFVESTTQQTNLPTKLMEDLKKCFNEEKTSLPIAKIEEVIFCHTSTLEPAEEASLRAECEKHEVTINFFGIGPISHDLHHKYPGITRDFLGIEIDTGQITTLDEFVTAYDKNAIATPLSTTFRFREKELEQVLQKLEQHNLVIISGKSGVGKTRLVLECCKQFNAAHSEYQVRCIFNRGQELFEDLQVYFSAPGNYLIFVDDANRISGFESFIQLLQHQRKDQQIKVIVTTRDYALEKVREVALPYRNKTELEIQHLGKQQIRQLITEEYDITNPFYLDHIDRISQGNPRIAIMAARVAKQENTLESIQDVSALYDQYYQSIQKDLTRLGNEDLLKAAGIIAFFQTVDRSEKEMMRAIEEAFGISQDAFWKTVDQLHKMELFDMYEDEVVRTSDQVLATYLFYLAFFKERLLCFSPLLKNFFPQLKGRLVDSLYPALNAFDREKIIEVMRPYVDQTWNTFVEAGDEDKLFKLIDVSWFFKETEVLLYARDRISQLEVEPTDISNPGVQSNLYIFRTSLLDILSLFENSDSFRNALKLIFRYLAKKPSELSRVIKLLTNRFGFEPTSYIDEFKKQQLVIDVLWDQTQEGQIEIFSDLFLTVAKHYLQTRFEINQIEGDRGKWTRFEVPLTTSLTKLRQKIWYRVFQLYKMPVFKERVLDLLHSYSNFDYRPVGNGTEENAVSIISQDLLEIIPFFKSELEPDSYRHCLIVHEYLDLLKKHVISFDEILQNNFTNETYRLSKILEEEQKFELFFSKYTLTYYEKFFQQCLDIQKGFNYQKNNNSHFSSRVIKVLLTLADRNPALYSTVLNHYLDLGDPLKLYSTNLINRLVQICGINQTYEILIQSNYPTKRIWLFNYYRVIPQHEIIVEHLEQLYALYRESDANDIPNDLNFLLNYQGIEDKIVVNVVKILLERTSENLEYSNAFSSLFTFDNKNLREFFRGNIDLLKRAYFITIETSPSRDYDGQILAHMIILDPSYFLEYINWLGGTERFVQYEKYCNYSFLWLRDDYEMLIHKLLENKGSIDKYEFFKLKGENPRNDLIRERQELLLKKLINRKYNDSLTMQSVFQMVLIFPLDKRQSFFAMFLEYNKSFEDFKLLLFEPYSRSWSESLVSMYQEHIEYHESLLPLLNTLDFLQHKQYIEHQILEYKEKIEEEKRKEFMRE
jgi:hypothetical protein